MNKRSHRILSLLITKAAFGQTVTIDGLAEIFGVSSRTIRNDIHLINDYLGQKKLSPLQLGKQGSVAASSDITAAASYLEEENFYSVRLSKDDRLVFTAVLLICASGYITLNEIADDLCVSRSTVVQDLEQTKSFFRENHLILLSHVNKGLLLEGRESDKRLMLFHMIRSSRTVFRSRPVVHHLIGCLPNITPLGLEGRAVIEKIINEAEHTYGRYLTDQAFIQLRDYLEFSLYRIQAGYVVERARQKNSKWEMAKAILDELQRYFLVNIPENEISSLGFVLNQLAYIHKTTVNREIVKMQVITRTFIINISKEIGMNLQGDYPFYENLVNHLESTLSAVDPPKLMDLDIQELMEEYPEVRNAVRKNVSVFEEYVGRTLSETEADLIVVHVCAAIERNRNDARRYSVVLVYDGGIGTAQLLLARLEKYFRLNVREIVPAHDLKNRNLEGVDLLISTVALPGEELRYVQVDPVLTDEDCLRVGKQFSLIQPKVESRDTARSLAAFEALQSIDRIIEQGQEHALEEIKSIVTDFFQEQRKIRLIDLLPAQAIRLEVSCSDWQEAIRESARYLLERGDIGPEYIEAMIRNVMQNGPYIVLAPGFAMPHEALNAGASRVGMSLIRLRKPVPFGKEAFDPVEWVCCLSAINKDTHLNAMFHLIGLFNNGDFRLKLSKCGTPEAVFEIIKQYESKMR